MKPLVIAFCLLAIGCGSQEEKPAPKPEETTPAVTQTEYGSSEEVKSYLDKINPYIQEVGNIQIKVDQAIGSAGKGTSKNLASAMEQVLPRLQTAHTNFSAIQPPPLLASLHRNIEKLMTIRLEAYRITVEGWKLERDKKDISWHEKAEAKLQQANDLIIQLNKELQGINLALEKATTPPQKVASP